MKFIKFFSFLFLFFSFSIFSCDHLGSTRDYFLIHGSFYDKSFAEQKRAQRQRGSNNNKYTAWQSVHGDASFVLSAVPNDVLVHMPANSYLPESSQSKPSISRSVVVKRSFDRVFDALGKIHNQCEAKQRKKEVDREFKKFEARLKQEEDFFAQRTNQVKEYGQRISGERRERRIAAIQKAVSNNFKVSYMVYSLDSSTLRLLKEKGIDPVSFESCLGNAIKQQIHAEFVSVLNESAALFLSDGVDHIDADWLCTIANCSKFGRQVNDACQYSLAHKLSDICSGIYNMAENCMRFGREVCEAGKEGIEEFYSNFSEQLEQAFLTSKYVLNEVKISSVRIVDGAWVEPFRQFVRLAYLTRHDPQLVAEHALKSMCSFADLVLKEAKLVKNILTSPFSAKMLESISSFEVGYAAPLRKTVYRVVDSFSKLSTREKVEKSLTVALQLATIKLPGFLIKKGADGAVFFGGTFAENIAFAADGGVAISAPASSGALVPIGSTAGMVMSEAGVGGVLAVGNIALLMSDDSNFGGGSERQDKGSLLGYSTPQESIRKLPFQPVKLPFSYERVKGELAALFEELGYKFPTKKDIKHIFDRHCSLGSNYQFNLAHGTQNASVFNFNDEQYIKIMLEALKKGGCKRGNTLLYDCGETIGTGLCGTKTSIVKIVFKPDGKSIRTVFPFVS